MLGFSTRTSGTVWLINSPTAPPCTYSDQYVTVQTDRYVTTGYRSALFSAHSPLPTFSRSTSTYLLRSVRDIQADRQTDRHYNWIQKSSIFSPLTLADVLPQHLHILIAISARLLVPETHCVHQFVHYDAFLVTTGTNREALRAWFRELLTY